MIDNVYCQTCKKLIFTKTNYCFTCGSTKLINGSTKPIASTIQRNSNKEQEEEKLKLIKEIKEKQKERRMLRRLAAVQSLAPAPNIKFKGKFTLSAMDYEDYQNGKITKAGLIAKNAVRYIPFLGLAADTLLEGASEAVEVLDFSTEDLSAMDIFKLKEIHENL